MNKPSSLSNESDKSFETPAIEIPSFASHGELSGRLNAQHYKDLNYRLVVLSSASMVENTLGKEAVNLDVLSGVLSTFVDATVALLNSNPAADQQVLRSFSKDFSELMAVFQVMARERGISDQFNEIAGGALGIGIDPTATSSELSFAISTRVSSEIEPKETVPFEDWLDEGDRPTCPYNDFLSRQIGQLNEESAPQSSLMPSSLSAENTSDEHGRHVSGARKRVKKLIAPLLAVAAVSGTAVIATQSVSSDSGNQEQRAEAVLSASAMPEKEMPPLKPVIADADEPNEFKETCAVQAESQSMANYLTIVKQGNPALAALLENAINSARVESSGDPEQDRIALMEAILKNMEANADPANDAVAKNIKQFISVHETGLSRYKVNHVWQGGNRQTELLHERVQPDCTNGKKE